MNANDIFVILDKSLNEFGTYLFYDKGPSEVIDIEKIVSTLNNQEIENVINILEEVSSRDDESFELVACILQNMQDISDDRWDLLMNPRLDAVFNREK